MGTIDNMLTVWVWRSVMSNVSTLEDRVLVCWYRQDLLKAELVLLQTNSGGLRRRISEGGLKAEVDAMRLRVAHNQRRLFDVKAELGRIRKFLQSEEVLDLLAL